MIQGSEFYVAVPRYNYKKNHVKCSAFLYPISAFSETFPRQRLSLADV